MRNWLRRPTASPPVEPLPPAPRVIDYKALWDEAARLRPHEAILTGADDEEFERAGERDAEMIARFVRPGDVVLDVGCGVGRVELYLAPRVAELWAVDVSGEMIRRAGERLAGLSNVHLREIGNRDYLSGFESSHFDLVFSFLVLQHLEREDAFLYLRDAVRVLKPGGLLFSQFPNYHSDAYARVFIEGADVEERSPGRVRVYTESEVRRTIDLLGLKLVDLWLMGHHGADAEICVAARKKSL